MPRTVFDIKGILGHRRERIETAVVASGKHVTAPHEAWIAADPFYGGFWVLIRGLQYSERAFCSFPISARARWVTGNSLLLIYT
jgi:hypothetical protein